ncbi:MAG: DUF4114 domain-containing protein, partial [Ferruginibacter sp.]|nr:DUF4114 domain-containing protein [Cytophagales bacterium]
ARVFFRGVPLGVFLTISWASFGQVGPYFYGKPNPSTGVPDPPVPATEYYTLGAYAGRPTYLDPVSDPINPPSNPDFLKQLVAALPEKADRSGNLGQGGNADVVVQKDNSEVFMVFATEGAFARNALGYFIYKGGASPTDLNAPNPLVPGKTYLESRRILFPNASLAGASPFESGSGGGQLKSGDRVKLVGDLPNGKFSQGTHLAWFIVSYGWDGTQVGNGSNVLYSNPSLNPGQRAQAAALDFTATEGRTVITFEDTKRTSDGGSDNDFNDVMFYLSQVEDEQTVFYPDCNGKFVLTLEAYTELPKDANGKLRCETPTPPVTNLSLTAICSDDPTQRLGWRVTNPDSSPRPYTWVITDGVNNNVKLASAASLVAGPGETTFYTNLVSGVNTATISVEGTVQPNGTRIGASLESCGPTPVVPPLACCAVAAAEVVAYNPGTDRAGKPLTVSRQDASQALGASGPAGSFVALGFSGTAPGTEASIALKFAKPVRGYVNLYETTFGLASTDFVETADVYGSLDGTTYYRIGTANNQEKGSVDIHRTTLELKGDYAQIQFLKLVDTTPKASMPNEADGFDLEAVCASDFALETVVPTADAQPGSVKLDQNQTKASQGQRKDGTPVWGSNPHVSSDSGCAGAGLCDPEGIDRRNLNSILARDDAFFSLGIGGSLEIQFQEPVTGSLIVYERTGDPKPTDSNGSINYLEKAAVYGKVTECNEWILLGYLDNQGPSLRESPSSGSFEHQTYKGVLPLGGRTIRYVKLVDVTPAFSTSTDGYDVDFIASTANASGASGSPEDGPGTVNPDVTPVGLVV